MISPQVLAFCRDINPGATPVYITITPGQGCDAHDCFKCVRQKVERDGGRIQFGWSIWEWPRVYIEAEHHAVYEPRAGLPLVDLTPPHDREVRRRLFLPDDTATYDFENEGVLRDNKRMALTDDPLVREFFAASEERVRILNSIPGVGKVSIDPETADALNKAEIAVARLTERLGSKYTSQNARCFCGSGQKFKRCHGQSRSAEKPVIAREATSEKPPIQGKPVRGYGYMEWDSFVEGCRKFFDEGRKGSLFPLVEAMDRVYQIAPVKSPFLRSRANDQATDSFNRCFFTCHRTFLSSAMAIASGLPEDGEAITRRALEIAKTCFAIKVDPENGNIWRSDEARLQRWRQRGHGEKPKPLRTPYEKVRTEPLYQELETEIGTLSDFAVHFTPEYFSRYTWEETPRPDGGSDVSFGLREGAIELAFLMLIKHHELVIRVFDYCQDGRMLQHPEIREALGRVQWLQNHYHTLVAPTIEAMVSQEPL